MKCLIKGVNSIIIFENSRFQMLNYKNISFVKTYISWYQFATFCGIFFMHFYYSRLIFLQIIRSRQYTLTVIAACLDLIIFFKINGHCLKYYSEFCYFVLISLSKYKFSLAISFTFNGKVFQSIGFGVESLCFWKGFFYLFSTTKLLGTTMYTFCSKWI